MFDEILDKLKQILASRLIPIFIILILLFSVLINRLFEIQIIEGQENSDIATLQETKMLFTDASRGLIRASNGEVLAGNELVYTVELHDVLTTNKEKNDILSYLIETLKEYGNELEVVLPISYDNGDFEFTVNGSELTTFKTNAFAEGKLTKEREDATAEEIYDYLRDNRFYIDEDYSIEESLEIMALRYELYIMWPPENPVIVCSDVDNETLVAIKEREPKLQGVSIGKQSNRYYIDSNEPFAHILGYTGLINESELEGKKNEDENKYDSFDIIGKAGVERSFEDILTGQKGVTNIKVDGLGNPDEVISSEDPTAGSDVYLTIDPDLQRETYNIIEKNLSEILLSKINNSKSAGTKGVSDKDIRIPIYDVYFAFINNEIINTNHFQLNDASDLEKQVYQTFSNKLDEVLGQLDIVLALNSTSTGKNLSEEMNEYLDYAYDVITKNNVIVKDKVNTSDEVHNEYMQDKISLSKYLQYVISSNWIDLDSLQIDNEYYNTDELYQKLIDYLKDYLTKDKDFHKLLYYYLIDSYKLSGTEICLLLFDQDVLEYNEEEVANLKAGSTSSYSFITGKLRDLEITPAQLGLEPFSASVVVTDVNTGKIKALVSYPSYDSNNYIDYLDNNLTSPLYPRAVREALAPGSTFKMVSSIAGLEENVISPHEKIKDEYIFTKTTPHARCNFNNHGHVNVVEAIEVSCNYFFYEVGYRLGSGVDGFNDSIGLDTLGYYSKLMGLGKGGDTNLESELGTTAYTSVSRDSVVRSAIGQGSNVFTPAELSTYVTTIANNGKRFDLTLIDKVFDGEKYVENKAKYTDLDEINDSNWGYVQQGMYLAGAGGTSGTSRSLAELADHGVTIAGKTGTSQVSKNNATHANYVSYAPYENPEISVTVVIPNGHAAGNAVELAKDVYSFYFNIDENSNEEGGSSSEDGEDQVSVQGETPED